MNNDLNSPEYLVRVLIKKDGNSKYEFLNTQKTPGDYYHTTYLSNATRFNSKSDALKAATYYKTFNTKSENIEYKTVPYLEAQINELETDIYNAEKKIVKNKIELKFMIDNLKLQQERNK